MGKKLVAIVVVAAFVGSIAGIAGNFLGSSMLATKGAPKISIPIFPSKTLNISGFETPISVSLNNLEVERGISIAGKGEEPLVIEALTINVLDVKKLVIEDTKIHKLELSEIVAEGKSIHIKPDIVDVPKIGAGVLNINSTGERIDEVLIAQPDGEIKELSINVSKVGTVLWIKNCTVESLVIKEAKINARDSVAKKDLIIDATIQETEISKVIDEFE